MSKTKIFTKFVVAFCLTLLFVASASAQEYDVVPGQRVGVVEIGRSRQTVHGKLGKPSGTYSIQGRGNRGDYWFSSDNSNTLRVFYDAAGSVYQISVTSPRFTTSEGLNSRSSLAEIRRSYGNLKVLRVSARGDIDYYYDPRKGVAFELTDQMDAHSSLVMKTYAVLVFRKGTSPQPEPDERLR
ncbi:MAG: hypothetical protein DMF68_01375 [Acidobacteria bacterium]|nr:MAG: hypothetical protein DMF68_01375 [Acidobacteriota bacterium]